MCRHGLKLMMSTSQPCAAGPFLPCALGDRAQMAPAAHVDQEGSGGWTMLGRE